MGRHRAREWLEGTAGLEAMKKVRALRTFQQGTVVINTGAIGDVVEQDIASLRVCWRKDREGLTDLYTQHDLNTAGEPCGLVEFCRGFGGRWR